MTIASSSNLIEALRDSRLLTAAQMDEVTGTLQGRFPDPRTLARELVQRGWLTPFQVNQLFQGRGQELVLGPYSLLERLGEGGMGQVFKARHQLMNRLVAVKLIRKERLAAPDAVRRFYREIQVVAQLSHPNIVIAHDAAQVRETHFFVMEYVEGVDLAKVVKQRGCLPVGEACDYIRQAALGLEHAYENGMVHRDIKPANLLVTARGGVVKVLDMGLARLQLPGEGDDQASQLTQEGSVMGTPDYIAPEQALDSHSVDIRSDIYSLGCTLYFLLTGQVPFPGGTLGEKLIKHQLKEPQAVEQLRPGVSAEVAAVLRKMMAKRPDDRYQTPRETALALEPFSQLAGATSLMSATTRTPGLAAFSSAAAQGRTEPLALPVTATQPVAVVFDHTIDPTAPLALPLSGSVDKIGTIQRWWVWARRHMWVALCGGAAVLAALILTLILLVRPSPPKHLGSGLEKGDQTPPEEAVVILGDEHGRHWGSVRCVAFHPIKELAASGGEDCHIRLWNTATLHEEAVLSGHTAAVKSVAFAPGGDRLLSGSDDGTMRLWHLKDHKEIRQFPGTSGAVNSVAFSPNGKLALAGSGSTSVLVFDVENGEKIRESFGAGTGNVLAVAFAPDGKHILTGGDDMILRLWYVNNAKLIQSFKGHTDAITSVAFSPDGNRILSGSSDKTVRLWKTASGKQVGLGEGHKAAVLSVAFAHDGRQALSAGLDRRMRLWKVGKGLKLWHRFPEQDDAVRGIAFSRDDRRALAACQDHLLRLWDVQTRKELLPRAGHAGQVQNLVFSRNGRRLLSAGADHTVRLWDLASRKPLYCLKTEARTVPFLAFSPDNNQLVYQPNNLNLRVCEVADGQPLRTLTLVNPYTQIKDLIVTADGFHALCGGSARNAFLFDLRNGNIPREGPTHMEGPVESIALAADGRHGLSGGKDWKIWLFPLQGNEPARPFAGHTDTVLSLRFTPDGQQALSAGADRAVWRWDLTGKGRTRLFSIPSEVEAGKPQPSFDASFAPNGEALATWGGDGWVFLWNVASGKKLRKWAHTGPVWHVAWAPDSKRLAVANASGTIAIYPVLPAARKK